MAKTTSHQLDIYGAWLHLATDRRAWKRVARKIGVDLPEPRSLGLTSMVHKEDSTLHLAIYLNASMLSKSGLAGQFEIIGHEATHASAMLLDSVGQQYDGESESLAYLIGWMAAWLWSGAEDALGRRGKDS